MKRSGSVLCAFVAWAGCQTDPCDGFPGKTCLTVWVDPAKQAETDRLAFEIVDPPLIFSRQESTPVARGAVNLPTAVALAFGSLGSPALDLTVAVEGFLGAISIGSGAARATIRRGGHTSVRVQLGDGDLSDGGIDATEVDQANDRAQPSDGPSDGTTDAAMDLARPADLANDLTQTVDLAPPPDLLIPWRDVSPGGTATLWGIGGSGPGDVYVVGDNGTILHSTNGGASWTPEDAGVSVTLHGVWAAAPQNIYVVGGGGTILHNAGNGWQKQTSPTMTYLNAIWGSSATDIYAVGSPSVIIHSSNGSTWTTDSSNPLTMGGFASVWGSDANHVYAGADNAKIVFGSLGSWTIQSTGFQGTVFSVWGTSASNVWAVDVDGNILHSSGGPWQRSTALGALLYGIWGSGASDLYAAGLNGSDGVVIHSADGTDWTADKRTTGLTLYGVWGTSASDVYAVGEQSTILHRP